MDATRWRIEDMASGAYSKYLFQIIGETVSSTNRGNKYNSFDHSRVDTRAGSFREAYNSKKKGSGRFGRKC